MKRSQAFNTYTFETPINSRHAEGSYSSAAEKRSSHTKRRKEKHEGSRRKESWTPEGDAQKLQQRSSAQF